MAADRSACERWDEPIRPGRLAGPRWLIGRRRFAAVLFASLALSGSAEAAFDAADTGWVGCSQLIELARSELGNRRVRVISSLDYSVLEPSDAIVFIHPTVDIRFHPLAAFLAAGGRAAVIDDHGRAAALLERFHIHRANAPALPELRVRGNSQLPIALPAASESSEPNDHPTLRGVEQVVTNHPTALRLEPGIELTPLLVLPARGEPDALLAVTGVIGDARACGLTSVVSRDTPPEGHCGRLLAMGDPSAFINLMMRYPGNRSFARGVFSYLLEDDTWGRRGGNLYLVNGDFKQLGSYGDPNGMREMLSEQQAALLDWIDDVRNNGLGGRPALLADCARLCAPAGACCTGRFCGPCRGVGLAIDRSQPDPARDEADAGGGAAAAARARERGRPPRNRAGGGGEEAAHPALLGGSRAAAGAALGRGDRGDERAPVVAVRSQAAGVARRGA
jgi:hypothetical protein